MTLVSWALCGLVVGLIARFLIPGRQNMSLLMTMALGIVGALVGGFLYWSIWGASGASFSLSGDAWQGWIVSIIGAGIVLWGYAVLHPRLWWQ
ncbi:MAG: GlsB/YeaQ/YmgE family stress response membrane protein [Planctomycetes bacterium]|nr:GlsB/YeaQ/YmgE family stress response membrane protein [Planctomycetota bacterium]